MKRALIVMNPKAGLKTANRYLAQICDLFCAGGILPTVYLTQQSGDGIYAAEHFAPGQDMLVCIGGDGTLSEAIEGLHAAKLRMPIGYIPAGSTNVTGASLHLSRGILRAARDILRGEERVLDLGEMNGKPFCYVASCGAFTRVTYATPQPVKNALGYLAYVLEATREVSNITRIPMHIETDEQTFEGEFLFCAYSNSTSVAGVVKLHEEKLSLSDGKMELLLVRRPKDGIELGQIINALSLSHFNTNLVHLVSTSHVTVRLPAYIEWTRDGEYSPGAELVELSCLPGAARFILPKRNPKGRIP